MKVRKTQFFITMKTTEMEKEKVSVKDSRRDALLEVGRLLASTNKNCRIKIDRVRGRHGRIFTND